MVLSLSLTLILGVLEQTLFLNYLFAKTACAVQILSAVVNER